jgi:bacillopeptidase F
VHINYTGSWGSNQENPRYNGTQTFSNKAGDTASFLFSGTAVTYLYAVQPNMGHAKVLIDGNVVTADLDEYSATELRQQITYTGLTYGTHTIAVQVLGTKDSTSTGTFVIVDGFLVDGATAGAYDDGDVHINYAGSWGSNQESLRYNDTQTFSSQPGDTATFLFTGTAVTYLYAMQPNMGHAKVLIDGTVVTADLDEYASTEARQRISYTGLPYGTHTLTVQVLGRKDSTSFGTFVIVDGFLVSP